MQDALMILILAGGSSSRMRGADKLLERIDHQPQLARIAQAALASGLPVRVALPPDRPDRHAALRDSPVQIVIVPDAATGMAASIRAGAAGWPGAVMILPADMPEISAQMIVEMVGEHRANPEMILRGASGMTPGHPVVIPADLAPLLQNLSGDRGAQPILAAYAGRLHLVPLPGQAAITDLDTPEDWARWRERREG